MLKFFFNRTSFMVRFMEILGVGLGLLYVKNSRALSALLIAYLLLFLLYLFVRICDFINWYPKECRDLYPHKKIGTEIHFQKSLVPTSYILAVTSTALLLHIPLLSWTLLLLSISMMIVIAGVNGILLYFHFKDHEDLPVNFFSSNRYLKERAS